MKLAGKVALITGTSPNIGGGIAEGLADEGAKVVCCDIQETISPRIDQLIQSDGGEAVFANINPNSSAYTLARELELQRQQQQFVTQQKSSPFQNTGQSSITSIWCAAPTHGSLARNMSPS